MKVIVETLRFHSQPLGAQNGFVDGERSRNPGGAVSRTPISATSPLSVSIVRENQARGCSDARLPI
jgi:hypothetical protein